MAWLYLFASCFLALIGHALVCRLRPSGNSVLHFFPSGITGFTMLVTALLLLECQASLIWACFFIYAFFCELYVFAFTFVANSISLQILFMLRGRDLSRADLDGIYSSKTMVSPRIQRLVDTGLVGKSGNAYVSTQKGKA